MAKTIVNTTDTLASWKEKTNNISVDLGDITQLATTEDSDAVGAINSVKSELGDLTSLTTTAKNTAVAAINELDGEVGDLANLTTIARNNLVNVINELETNHNKLDSDLGGNGGANDPRAAINVRSGSQNGFSQTQSFAAAINELADSMGRGSLGMSASTVKDALREHEADIGNMTFTGLSATNISAAVRELRTEVGDVTALDTTATTSAVAGINELVARVDSVDALIDQAVKTTSNVLFPQVTLGTAGGGSNSVYTNAGVTRTGDYTVDVSGNVVLDADNATWSLKDGGTTRFEFSGTTDKTLSTSSGNFTLDVGGNIELNADGSTWTLKDATVNRWVFSGTTDKTLQTGTTGNFLLDVASNVTIDAGSGVWKLDKAGTTIVQVSADTDVTVALPNTTDYTLDVVGNIAFSADGGTVSFKDGDSDRMTLTMGANQEIDIPVGDLTIDVAGEVTVDVGSDANNPGYFYIDNAGDSGMRLKADGHNIESKFWHVTSKNNIQHQSTSGTHYFGNDSDYNLIYMDMRPIQVNSGLVTIYGRDDLGLAAAGGSLRLAATDGEIELKTNATGSNFGTFKKSASGNNLIIETGTGAAVGVSFVDIGSNKAKSTFGGPVFLDSALQTDITGKSVGGALNQLDTEVDTLQTLIGGTTSSYSITNLSSTTVKTQIQEIANELYSSGTSFTGLSATNFRAAANELRVELGDNTALTTTATNAVGAINEVYSYAQTTRASLNNLDSDIDAIVGGVGNLDTLATNVVGAINELSDSIGSGGLNTTAQSLVGAVNELDARTTTDITEGTNQYFTTARARSSVSATNSGTGYGALAYNSSTGVLTYTKVTADNVRSALSAGEGIDFSSGVISAELATTSNRGVASFNSSNFGVSSGAVSIASGGVGTSNLASASVTYDKLQRATTANRVLAAATDGGAFVETQVTSAMLANDTITFGKLQRISSANRLLGSTTAGGSVSEVQVNTSMIQDGAITTAKLSSTSTIVIKNVSGTEIARVTGIGA